MTVLVRLQRLAGCFSNSEPSQLISQQTLMCTNVKPNLVWIKSSKKIVFLVVWCLYHVFFIWLPVFAELWRFYRCISLIINGVTEIAEGKRARGPFPFLNKLSENQQVHVNLPSGKTLIMESSWETVIIFDGVIWNERLLTARQIIIWIPFAQMSLSVLEAFVLRLLLLANSNHHWFSCSPR